MLRWARPQRGAVAILVLALSGSLFAGAIGGLDCMAAVRAQGHAETAADAAAHGAASLLAADGDRDALSIAVQAGQQCGAGGSLTGAAAAACSRARALAADVATGNGGVLMRLVVGPDVRDDRADRGAGRLVALALVAVRRNVPVLPLDCPRVPPRDPDVCWAQAWSAAQEAG